MKKVSYKNINDSNSKEIKLPQIINASQKTISPNQQQSSIKLNSNTISLSNNKNISLFMIIH